MSEGTLTPERYVELISVTVFTNAIDVFARGVGVECFELPEAIPGEPSRQRPESARGDGAWVPQIPADEKSDSDYATLYGGQAFVPQIALALSLVPDEVRLLNDLSDSHYMSIDHVGDPGYSEANRAIDRLQMELVASRVSAINECFY